MSLRLLINTVSIFPPQQHLRRKQRVTANLIAFRVSRGQDLLFDRLSTRLSTHHILPCHGCCCSQLLLKTLTNETMQAKQLAQESALALYYGSTKVIVSMPEQSLHSNKEGGIAKGEALLWHRRKKRKYHDNHPSTFSPLISLRQLG